jgi:hypothetical protein
MRSSAVNAIGVGVVGLVWICSCGCERTGGPVMKLESPQKTYVVSLSGQLSAPKVPFAEHRVRLNAQRGSMQIVEGHEIDYAHWFDRGFKGRYGAPEWPKENVLRFVSIQPSPYKGRPDVVRVENQSSRPVSLLKVHCLDMFLLFELPAGSVTSFEATPQRAQRFNQSWIDVDGEWSTGARILGDGRDFELAPGTPAYQYAVSISERGIAVAQRALR